MTQTQDPAAKSVVCPSCGFQNSPPPANGRCVSCGASMAPLRLSRSRAEELERRYQQEGFDLRWLGISAAVQTVLTGAIVLGLPVIVPVLDFEGINGMLVTIPVWLIGGTLIGLVSPGRTFLEPVAATILVAIVSVLYLFQSQTVRTMPWWMYVIMACIGILFTLIGSYLGERIQAGPVPKRAD